MTDRGKKAKVKRQKAKGKRKVLFLVFHSCLLPLALCLLPWSLFADQRTQPPTISDIAPNGVVRGKTVTIQIEGTRLEGTTAILFDNPAVTGKIVGVKELPQEPEKRTGVNSSIDLGDRPAKNQVAVEVSASEKAGPGIVRFRVVTPLGTSNTGVLAVSPYDEFAVPVPPAPETPGAVRPPVQPFSPTLQVKKMPVTLVGAVPRPGEASTIFFDATGNEQYVFQIVAGAIGSSLEPELILRDGAGVVLADVHDNVMITPFLDGGRLSLEVRDYQHRGGPRYFYRLNAGIVPYVNGGFPLGFQRGKPVEVALFGANLLDHDRWKPEHDAAMSTVPDALNQIRLAVGDFPEVFEQEGTRRNDTPQSAQPVPVPVTINGVIAGGLTARGVVDRDYYRFPAKKGQHLVLEVNAARLGSPLDSVIEVLDAQGKPIERAVLRAVAETSVTLNDPESTRGSFRILSFAGIHVNDYLYVANELLRVAVLPRGPDEDIFFNTASGRRIGYLDTTPSSLAVNTPVYKVEVHPPGAQFPSNGLPVTHLYYRNDDAQGMSPTRDSLLHFTAPADGDYLVRIEDARGMEDDRFAYRLTIRNERPDFTITANPANPNVPRGGRVVVQVNATRLDNFNGAIDVHVDGLPDGVHAGDAVIPPGQDSTIVEIAADSGAELAEPAAFRITGRSGERSHEADAGDRLRLLSLAPQADVKVWMEPATLAITPGQTLKVKVNVERAAGFTGRVPVDIRNLPPGVFIPDIGLNGVLVNEKESSREFTLVAQDWAAPIEQPLYAVARVETRSPTASAYASVPLVLVVKQSAK
jgi:hypothetical protein